MEAKSASSTAPIEIPTILPVDNLINNRLAQSIGFIRRKHIPDPELPELRYSDECQPNKINAESKYHLFCNEGVVYTFA